MEDYTERPFPYFCCTYHELLYSNDFSSDSEDSRVLAPNHPASISFLEKVPGNPVTLSYRGLLKRETASQCDFLPENLLKLSYTQVIPSDPITRTLGINYRNTSPVHTPLLTLPSMLGPERAIYQCKQCSRVFASGAALGGHSSKLHKKK